ncbi:hypothetical protein Tco_0325141 [Tanacetum coccineum]
MNDSKTMNEKMLSNKEIIIFLEFVLSLTYRFNDEVVRSDDKFSQLLTQLQSQHEVGSGGGSGGGEDDEPCEDEDAGEDEDADGDEDI